MSCEECKYALFIEGFEQDPVCIINDGIECARKGTWRSFKKRKKRLILKKGGIEEMIDQTLEAIFREEKEKK